MERHHPVKDEEKPRSVQPGPFCLCRIKAAGLDVMVNEPPREDNPLLKLDNCFITPHIAWATYEARVRLMNQTVKNLRSFIEGNIINNVAM